MPAQVNQYLLQFEWWVAMLLVAGVAAIQLLLTTWLKARLENSIRHEYSKQLEEYRYDIEIRKRAEQVAKYLSLLFCNVCNHSNTVELNRMSWELAMWLPADIYCKLAHAVVERDVEGQWTPLIIEIRKILLKNQEDGLVAENIVFHIPQ